MSVRTLGLLLGRRPDHRAVHVREAGEQRDLSRPDPHGLLGVIVDGERDVGGEGDLGIETSFGTRLARDLHAPERAIDICADVEADPVGMAGGGLDHARSGRGDVDGHLGSHAVHVADVAGLRRVGQAERVHVALLEADALASQVGLQLLEIAFERADRVRGETKVRQGRVAPTDAHVRPPAALGLDGGNAGRGDRGVPGEGVGHAGPQLDARGRVGGQRHRDVAVRGEILAVDPDDPVVAHLLGLDGHLHAVEDRRVVAGRHAGAHRPELDCHRRPPKLILFIGLAGG